MEGTFVYKVSIARRLVKMGYKIIDLKPARTKTGELNFSATVFVFEDTPGLQKAIDVLKKIESDKKYCN